MKISSSVFLSSGPFVRSNLKRVVLSISLLVILGGCASTTNFDESFGKSVTAIRISQTKSPMASLANKDKSIDGIEGRAAREAMQRYYQSFVEPPPPVNVFNIGVGSGNN
jgi:hypothetical protein